MRDLQILPAVLRDVADAASWHDEDGHPGLGDRFIATFYSYFPHIQENGEIYRRVYLVFHKIIIRPFPYSVFYRLHNDVWILTLVMRAARRPSRSHRILQQRR